MPEIKRMWINQPSTLQPLHALHGTNVLAVHEYGDTMRIYFLCGNVISQQCSRLCLSDGWQYPGDWRDHNRRKARSTIDG